MLRYQQWFEFFETHALGRRVYVLNLSEEALFGDLDAVLARIVHDVGTLHPGTVVVDSFRSLVHAVDREEPAESIE
jgi:circadian clock protein KaiC